MKISSCSLRCDNRSRVFFVAAALVLKPFGPVPDLLKAEKPWHGFYDEGPVLTMMRAQKAPLTGAGTVACKDWVAGLAADRIGHELGSAGAAEYAAATPDWGPWGREELEGIESCTQMPCDVKLNAAETARLAAAEKPRRQERFFELVLDRVHRYQKTQERKEYEFAGDPVDPWRYLETLGLRSPLAPSPGMRLELRRVAFFPGRVKTMHQILDTRISVAPDSREATLWRRDVYTDHYFDSWGEWADVSCAAGEVVVVQAVMLELDLMKKTDLLSRLMRSKMRGAAEDNGAIYLNTWFERIRRGAMLASQPTPSPIPQGELR